MPEIKRLESPPAVKLYFDSERRFKLTIFEVYTRFKDLLLEEMRAHYAFRIAVPVEKRKSVFKMFDGKIVNIRDLIDI